MYIIHTLYIYIYVHYVYALHTCIHTYIRTYIHTNIHMNIHYITLHCIALDYITDRQTDRQTYIHTSVWKWICEPSWSGLGRFGLLAIPYRSYSTCSKGDKAGHLVRKSGLPGGGWNDGWRWMKGRWTWVHSGLWTLVHCGLPSGYLT